MKKIFNHPGILLAIIGLLTLFFAFQLPHLTLSNDVLKFIPQNDREVLNYDKVKKQFGSDLVIDVALKTTNGTIFTKDFLNLVTRLTNYFSKIPGVVSVSSISNTDYISGTDDGMEVQPLLAHFNGTDKEITALKTKLLSWNIYKGLLYSRDFTATQIGIKLDPDISSEKIDTVYFTIEKELKKLRPHQVKWYVAGMPAVTVLINSQMRDDLLFLIPLVILVVIGTLYLSFKKLGGVVLPLATVLISGIWTLGLMAFLHRPLSIMDSVIPVILVAVGSAYGIHIVSHYYDELRKENNSLSESKHKEIVMRTLHRIGLPVFLAGITTLIGFGSLISSTVLPMRSFGIFTAAGVAISLLVALTFIPAVLLVRHRALKNKTDKNKTDLSEKLMEYLYYRFSRHKRRIILFTIFIILAGIYGTTKIVKDNILIAYFKKNTEISRADRFLRKNFNGTTTFDIIVTGKEKGSLTNPRVLAAMDGLGSYLKHTYPEVTAVLSLTDFIKKMNQAMNNNSKKESPPSPVPQPQTGGSGFTSFFNDTTAKPAAKKRAAVPQTSHPLWNKGKEKFTYNDFLNVLNTAYTNSSHYPVTASELVHEINKEMNYKGMAYYEIPENPAKYSAATQKELQNLISQYLLLYSGQLNDWTDDNLEPREAKMIVQLNTPGTLIPHRIALDAEKYAKSHFPPGYTVETVGTSKIMYVLTHLIVSSQTRSILLSLLLVFVILGINYRSLIAGMIGIVPVALTVLINFGVMGLLKIRLDMSTAMVSAVSIGIGIDYTIHYLSYYRFERLKSSDLKRVELHTMKGAGKAIIFNAFSVAGGFLVLLLSKFTPLNYFGLLVAITMITSSTASLTLLPILLEIIKPDFIQKEKHA